MRKLSLTLAALLSSVVLSHATNANANAFGVVDLGSPVTGGFDDAIVRGGIVSNIVQTTLTYRHDIDTLHISSCQGDEKLTASAVRLQVRDEPAKIVNVFLFYGNGEYERVDLKPRFEKDTDSRWVFLNRGARCIKEVRIVGHADGRRGKPARIHLQALLDYRDEVWNPNGHVMGIAFTVLSPRGMTANLQVGTCKMDERVTALKIMVGVQSAQIDQVQVTYGNGEIDELPVRGHYRRGEHSRWIDVVRHDRCIKSIKVKGRTTSGNGSYTRVLVGAKLSTR